MLKEIHLDNFKAFERFSVSFGNEALLVGANNAGKSTLLSALRLAGRLTQHATRVKPNHHIRDRDANRLAYTFSGEQLGLTEENLRHEFKELEVRVVVKFSEDQSVTAVWPPSSALDDDGPEAPYFYLDAEGGPPTKPAQVKRMFPQVGIVPVLAPLERSERILDREYVSSNIDGRLTSRHVRNQLFLLSQAVSDTHASQLEAFLEFADPWLSEMRGISLRPNYSTPENALDVFYMEPGSRTEREIYWAGDGLQVWLQILMHIFRLRESKTILIDEPDIYLHADLQRRLVHLLEDTSAQTITATHSSEMIAESSSSSLIWVDKNRKRAVRAPKDEDLGVVSKSLGTAFNLHLAKALRSSVALFVEGHDMRLIRSFARRIGAANLAQERGVAIIKLEGFSRWDRVEPFKWLIDAVLERALTVWVILDRDYRKESAIQSMEAQFQEVGIEGKIWRRKEVESYLLEIPLLSRASKVEESQVQAALWTVTSDMYPEVHSRMLAEEQRNPDSRHHSPECMIQDFNRWFDEQWGELRWRLHRAPAKDVLSGFNRWIQEQSSGGAPVSARKLANDIRQNELATEMRDRLLEVESGLGD